MDFLMNKTYYLATRIQRLLASIIDGFILIALTAPLLYSMLTFSTTRIEIFFIDLLGYIIFMLINYSFLVNDGQTIGKKILKIKIVNLEGEVPSKKFLAIRYSVFFISNGLPFNGIAKTIMALLSLVNVLFIFRKDKRCLHDHIAKTIVIKSNT